MKNKNTIIGVILICLGIIWFAENLNLIHFEISNLIKSAFDLWPLILVVIGINLLIGDEKVKKLVWLLFVLMVIAYSVYIQNNGPITTSIFNNNDSFFNHIF